MTKIYRFAVALICISAVNLAFISPASAAGGKKPGGITISPAFQQISIASGQQTKPVNFTITNGNPAPQTFDLSVADFNTLGESGGLFFVGTNPTQLQKKYGLAKWVSLGQSQITLQPGQSQVVKADVLNLPDMSPGGHYGALMVSARTAEKPKGTNPVSIQPIASSLMFVTKLGGDTHKLSLSSVSFKRNVFSLPASVSLQFHNDGNTHLVPRGNVTITGPGGKLVGKGIINEDSNIILPQTSRQLYVPISQITSSSSPGKYVLHADFRFDGFDQYRAYQKSFVYIPALYLLVVLAIIALAGGAVYAKRKKIPSKLIKPKR